MAHATTYLRFVLSPMNPDTGVRAGVFSAAYKLRDSDESADAERTELRELLDWFHANLNKPDRFNRTKSKGFYRRRTKAISWFKSEATEHTDTYCGGDSLTILLGPRYDLGSDFEKRPVYGRGTRGSGSADGPEHAAGADQHRPEESHGTPTCARDRRTCTPLSR